MKIWYHLLAALVGLAIAALIVYAVFGTASEEGATQEGSAGSLGSTASALCGTIEPGDGTSEATRTKARENQPSLYDAQGPIPAIADNRPEQQSWVDRVHAAAGLCTDEIRILEGRTTIALSTVEGVSEAHAAAFTIGALNQAFTAPFNPPGCTSCQVTLVASVDGSERTVVISRRAWDAFQLRRESLGIGLTMRALVQFRQATSFRQTDLRVVGWKLG